MLVRTSIIIIRKKNDALRQSKFSKIMNDAPIFFANETKDIETYLRDRVPAGMGMDVVQRIDKGHYRPSKKLMKHVGNVIRGKPEYVLLDEQQVVYEKVLSASKKTVPNYDSKKRVVLIKGGLGTGKSIVA